MTRPLFLLALLALSACATPTEEATSKTTVPAEDAPIAEEIFYPSGELKMSGKTLAGEKHGEWTAYFKNGGIWSRNVFDKGVQNGPSTVYHSNGMLYYSGNYEAGERVGEWIFYDDDGKLAKKLNYDEEQ